VTHNDGGKRVSEANPLDRFVSANATHYLMCSHCMGQHCKDYVMRCIILKDMGEERVKVVVFGERNWRNKEHIKRIRYVPKWRLSVIVEH